MTGSTHKNAKPLCYCSPSCNNVQTMWIIFLGGHKMKRKLWAGRKLALVVFILVDVGFGGVELVRAV